MVGNQICLISNFPKRNKGLCSVDNTVSLAIGVSKGRKVNERTLCVFSFCQDSDLEAEIIDRIRSLP